MPLGYKQAYHPYHVYMPCLYLIIVLFVYHRPRGRFCFSDTFSADFITVCVLALLWQASDCEAEAVKKGKMKMMTLLLAT